MAKKISKLSIVIPCYNEINSIENILQEINSVDLGEIKKEIIIVDDGSKDGTRELLKKLNKNNQYKVILHEKNQGKTGALKTGIAESTGDILIIQDADEEYDPRDYKKLIRPFEIGDADVVYGSRFIGDAPKKASYAIHGIANKMMTMLSNLLSGLGLTDIHTCYIMMKGDLARELMPKITSKKFGFNPEIAARLGKRRKNLKIYETGIAYYGRTKAEGKKIGYKDGIQAIKDIVYYNVFVRE